METGTDLTFWIAFPQGGGALILIPLCITADPCLRHLHVRSSVLSWLGRPEPATTPDRGLFCRVSIRRGWTSLFRQPVSGNRLTEESDGPFEQYARKITLARVG